MPTCGPTWEDASRRGIDFIETRREIGGVRKELGEHVVGLRRAVIEYRTSVVGHGILISDLEARPRRVEEHLDLVPSDSD